MILCMLDCSHITTREILHNTLAEVLELPVWYGKNLDALHDCLTDISRETLLRITHLEALREALNDYADIFLQVITDAAAENPRFTFEIA